MDDKYIQIEIVLRYILVWKLDRLAREHVKTNISEICQISDLVFKKTSGKVMIQSSSKDLLSAANHYSLYFVYDDKDRVSLRNNNLHVETREKMQISVGGDIPQEIKPIVNDFLETKTKGLPRKEEKKITYPDKLKSLFSGHRVKIDDKFLVIVGEKLYKLDLQENILEEHYLDELIIYNQIGDILEMLL